jgi:hypothetical protein
MGKENQKIMLFAAELSPPSQLTQPELLSFFPLSSKNARSFIVPSTHFFFSKKYP